MGKVFTINYDNHIASRRTKLSTALRIVREDDAFYGFTSHDSDSVIDDLLYRANPGLLTTSIVTTASPAVGGLELTTLHDNTIFTLPEIKGGVWRNAGFFLFRYNWSAPNFNDIEPLLAGVVGEVHLKRNRVVAEFRDLRQYLQQSVGIVSSKTCRARLGDELCMVDLGPFTVTGTLTHVTGNQVFRDSSRTEPNTHFAEGEFKFTSGPNTNLRFRIKDYNDDGTFTLWHAMPSAVAVGHTYQAVAGCLKRFEEDCITKYNNPLNYQGEPHRRGVDVVTASPTVAA